MQATPSPFAASAPERADVRLGGSWSPRQRLKNDALVALVRLAALAGSLPEGTRRGLGRMLGRLAYHAAPALRRLAEEQLARLFPGEERFLAKHNYLALGELLGELVGDARGGAPAVPWGPGARATLELALKEGHGVVVASAHLGNFERVATTLAEAVPLLVVGRESYDPRLMSLYAQLRRYDVAYRGAPGAGLRMARALRDGRALGIPMDLRTRAPSIPVPFLGQQRALVAVGPARLALRFRAAVVVATLEPTGAGLVELTATRVPTHDLTCDDAGERALTARLAAELERRIARLPWLWPWMGKR